MAARIIELFAYDELVSYTDPYLKLPYVILETDDPAEADALIATVRLEMVQTAVNRLFFNTYTKKNIGGQTWTVEITYGKDPPRSAGKITFQADSGGTTIHITQSKETRNSWAIDAAGANIAAENFKRAIGVNDDKVEGVDWPGTDFRFTVSRVYGDEELDEFYIGGLPVQRGNINDRTIRFLHKGQELTFARGTLRFEDFHVNDPGQDLWEISYTFHFAFGSADIGTIGDLPAAGSNPATIGKDGWDVLWVLYDPAPGARRWLKRPTAVYTERVGDYIDYETTFQGIFTVAP